MPRITVTIADGRALMKTEGYPPGEFCLKAVAKLKERAGKASEPIPTDEMFEEPQENILKQGA